MRLLKEIVNGVSQGYRWIVSQSMAASFNSAAQDVSLYNYGYSVQAIWTGTPTGVLQLECSNDNINWDLIPGTAAPAGSADSFMWNVIGPMYHYTRLQYTRTSGTGTLNALFVGKGHNT